MKVYLSVLFTSIFLAMLYQSTDAGIKQYYSRERYYFRKRKVDRSLCILCAVASAIPFIVITGLRYRVGTDYMYYATSFVRVSSGSSSYFKNPVYNLFERATAMISDDYIAFFCVLAVVFVSCYWIVIYKQSISPAYSIFLFWGTNTYYISLNGVRQGMAMAFLFVAIYYTIKGDLKKYLLFFLLGVLTHRGVLFFLPFYWIAQSSLTPKKAWEIYIASSLIGIGAGGVLVYIVRLLGYGYYINGMFNTGEFEWYITLINLVIFLVFCFYSQTAVSTPYYREFRIYYWLQLLALASVTMSVAIPLAKRVCWVFSIGQILSLPLLNKFEKSKIGRVILNAGIILGFALSIYIGIVRNGAHKVLPYRWYTERTLIK